VQSVGDSLGYGAIPGAALESEMLARPKRDRKKPYWFSDYVVDCQ